MKTKTVLGIHGCKIKLGSLIVVFGKPGAGKSTWLLQSAVHSAGLFESSTEPRVLWIESQESLSGIKERADRLNIDTKKFAVRLLLEDPSQFIDEQDDKYDVIVVDALVSATDSDVGNLIALRTYAQRNQAYVFVVYNLGLRRRLPKSVSEIADFTIRIAGYPDTGDTVATNLRSVMIDDEIVHTKIYELTEKGFVPRK